MSLRIISGFTVAYVQNLYLRETSPCLGFAVNRILCAFKCTPYCNNSIYDNVADFLFLHLQRVYMDFSALPEPQNEGKPRQAKLCGGSYHLTLWIGQEHGAVLVEGAIVMAFWILFLLLITELGFMVSSWHSLNVAAGEVAETAISLPLPDELYEQESVIPLNTTGAACITSGSNKTLTKAQGKTHIACLAGQLVAAEMSSKEVFLRPPAQLRLSLSGSVNSPDSLLQVTLEGEHAAFFGLWPNVTISGSSRRSYVFPPY